MKLKKLCYKSFFLFDTRVESVKYKFVKLFTRGGDGVGCGAGIGRWGVGSTAHIDVATKLSRTNI